MRSTLKSPLNGSQTQTVDKMADQATIENDVNSLITSSKGMLESINPFAREILLFAIRIFVIVVNIVLVPITAAINFTAPLLPARPTSIPVFDFVYNQTMMIVNQTSAVVDKVTWFVPTAIFTWYALPTLLPLFIQCLSALVMLIASLVELYKKIKK